MADVAPAISAQLVPAESVQRCHLYVLLIAIAWELNVTAEVNVWPEPAFPVGAEVLSTVGL